MPDYVRGDDGISIEAPSVERFYERPQRDRARQMLPISWGHAIFGSQGAEQATGSNEAC